jgi:hypothetical protein
MAGHTRIPLFSVSVELSDEQFVETGVVSQFRVECCHRTGSVPNENRNAVVRRQDVNCSADMLYPRCPDKHCVKGGRKPGDVEIRFEAVKLAAVPVAAHRDVDQVETTLIWSTIKHIRSAKNHPGTGAKDWHPVNEQVAQRFSETTGVEEHRHSCTFTAGQDEGINAFQVLRLRD